MAQPVEEQLAEETPVVMAYNLVPHAVMMATPRDLEEFGVGFSVMEGIVAQASDIERTTVVRHARGIEVQMEIAVHRAAAVAAHREAGRSMAGRTGCGLCGTADVERVLRPLPLVDSELHIETSAIAAAMEALARRQPLNDATGAMHAAGWARSDGTLAAVREDVGRHNALDKLAGWRLGAGTGEATGFVVLTSRGSFELVQKAALLGVPLVATVSAPTALAVRVAEEAGITLVGFARASRMTVYAHPERLQ